MNRVVTNSRLYYILSKTNWIFSDAMQINFLKYFALMQLHINVFYRATSPRHNVSFKTKKVPTQIWKRKSKFKASKFFLLLEQSSSSSLETNTLSCPLQYTESHALLQWSQLYSRLPFSQTNLEWQCFMRSRSDPPTVCSESMPLVSSYLGRYVNEAPLWSWEVCPSTLTRRRTEGIPASTPRRPGCQTPSR